MVYLATSVLKQLEADVRKGGSPSDFTRKFFAEKVFEVPSTDCINDFSIVRTTRYDCGFLLQISGKTILQVRKHVIFDGSICFSFGDHDKDTIENRLHLIYKDCINYLFELNFPSFTIARYPRFLNRKPHPQRTEVLNPEHATPALLPLNFYTLEEAEDFIYDCVNGQLNSLYYLNAKRRQHSVVSNSKPTTKYRIIDL